MTLIVCVDDKMGMAFNNRRQSRDRTVCEDIVKITNGNPIYMQDRSVSLFENLNANTVTVQNPNEAISGIYFSEFENVDNFKVDRLILYRWNRHYPADLYFDLPLDTFTLIDSTEFAGNSHEKITREVYINGTQK